MSAGTCPQCHEPLAYLDDAVVSACPQCGIVVDDLGLDLRAETSAQGSARYRHGDIFLGALRRNGADASTGPAPSAALLQRTPSEQRRLRQQANERELDRFVAGVLPQLDLSGMKSEVSRLLQQVVLAKFNPEVKVEQRRAPQPSKQRVKELAAAAVFTLARRRGASLHLDDVCEAANLPLACVASALVELERLLGKVSADFLAYETPLSYIDKHIAFLLREASLKPRSAASDISARSKATTSLLDARDIVCIRQADVDSSSYRKQAEDLALLCAEQGLLERSAKGTTIGRVKDMSLCAWAIIMHAVEGQLRKPLHEDNFARAAAWALDPSSPAADQGWTRAELGLVRSMDGDADGLSVKKLAARKTAISTVQTYVKLRYMEIRRVLSALILETPTHGVCKPTGGEDADFAMSRAIKPLPRADVAKRMAETLLLRKLAYEKKSAQDDSVLDTESTNEPDTKTRAWSRFWSSATIAKHRSQCKEECMEEDKRDNTELPSPLAALFDEQESAEEGSSLLAQRLGPTLASLDSLQIMSDDVLDRLLFAPRELDDVICSSDEIAKRRAAMEVLRDGIYDDQSEYFAGEKKHKLDLDNVTVQPPKTRIRNGKHTRALDHADFNKILESL